MSGVSHLSALKSRLFEKYASGQMASPLPGPDAITAGPAHRSARLSVAQQEFYLHESLSPGIPPLYNESISVHMNGVLDNRVLERSFAEVIRRHDIWRTRYAKRDGQLVQIVRPPDEALSLPVRDFSQVSEPGRTNEIQSFMDRETRRPFSFESEPLIRASLLKTSTEGHTLFIVAHLSVVDGVSVYQILPTELAHFYQAFSARKSSPLPELSVQFRDFAEWQRNHLDNHAWADQIAFWEKQLDGAPLLNWPGDRAAGTGIKAFRGRIQSAAFSEALTEQIKYFSRIEGVTMFVTLLAGFAALLHLYADQTDIVIGTFSPSGRHRPELSRLLGHFINPVALRLHPSADLTFRELVRQACDVAVQSMKHDLLPLQTLIQETTGRPSSGRNPYFNFGISLQPPMPSIRYDWTVTSMDAQSGGAPWDLYIAFIERPSGMMGRIQYDPDVFEDCLVEQMWSDLEKVLKIAASHPEERLLKLRSACAASISNPPRAGVVDSRIAAHS